MLFHSIFSAAVLLAASAIASPLPTEIEAGLDKRQSATTCGSYSYSAAKVRTAFNSGYSHYQAGDKAGSSTYPHTYNNYEGFDFPVAGPYQEYPLLKSGSAYTGGSPGADRVIFTTSGRYAGAITHTGASGNNFVGCSGTS